MCVTCGCSDDSKTTITNSQTGEKTAMNNHHSHTHTLPDGTVITHTHSHTNTHEHPTSPQENNHQHQKSEVHAKMHGTTISLEQNILQKNNILAAQNRGWFKGRNILALNLVSSPGSGKTTLLARTINDLKSELTFSVIEGDQETINDAEKIRQTGCNVVQINTGKGCHLEAAMIEKGYTELNPPLNSVLMIENVGNLVCPALFDLGENFKVAILSVTEGEDKPIKYPYMFRESQVMILTKIDLLPYLQFDVNRCIEYAKQVNSGINIFQVSSTSGEGLNDWYKWLKNQIIS
ncbi:MAG: hydrogenase nickel incorporation protein HypB [Okeania sp. SIO3H1]|nr:hydrogenase nickel incorporation protein HypB [Okeania sp. SIO3H1]